MKIDSERLLELAKGTVDPEGFDEELFLYSYQRAVSNDLLKDVIIELSDSEYPKDMYTYEMLIAGYCLGQSGLYKETNNKYH